MHIRTAHESEAPELSSLVERSKEHWGYSAELMEVWREQGAFNITEAMCASGESWVAENGNNEAMGFYNLWRMAPDEARLDYLFVDPCYIGSGQRVGEQLLRHAFDQTRQLGMHALTLWADPNAVGFYERYDLEQTGDMLSDPRTGRSLPKMRINLNC